MPPCKPLGTTVGHTGDIMGVGASSPDPPQIPPEMGRKKRGVAPLLTLRKRLARRRWRASKGFDHAQVFNDFLNSAGWTVREVAALVHEYEATAALRELTAQADAARPPARSCRADLGRLLESRLCADVTLAYRGTAFPAHRALLSARCPFFRDLLSEAGGGPRQQMMVVEMDIPGVGVELFGDLLRYLYTGELSVAGEAGSSAALSTLLRLSEQFGVPNPLAHDLRRMLEGGHLADTSLVWEVPGSGGGTEQEAEFPCHRAVLAARCPFFRGVIQRRTTTASGSGAACDAGGTTPGGRMRVVLDAGVVPVRHARVLLWALYQDTVDLSMLPCSSGGSLADEFMELYQVARLIEVDSLAQACEDALVELLGPDTLCGVLQWSEQPHGSPWVHRQAMAFLAEEFSALAVTPLLFQLTKGQLLTLLQSDCLQFLHEWVKQVVRTILIPILYQYSPGVAQESFGKPLTMPCADLGLPGLARVRPPARQRADDRATTRPPAAASSSPISRLPTAMEIAVQGQEVTPEELSDTSWQTPGLRTQEQCRAALHLAAAAKSPRSKQASASPPQPRRHAPLPRLPADTIHVVGHPKTPVDLTKLQPWHLYTALLQAASLQDLPPASRDTVQIHPVNNTFTLSVVESARAQAYLRITSLTVSGTTFTIHLYPHRRTTPYGAYSTTPSTISQMKPSLTICRQAILHFLLWVPAVWARLPTSWSPSRTPNYPGGSSTMESAFASSLSATRWRPVSTAA
ncbi:BTB/POZ domain-containing protein 7 isoform X2 [Dermacentor variabilis]|uniref:BTB/POZ domain-containing protein 7 isoform X2 n=1 Tax=Dermacentor variabilis TaxID=34621 RepID=UPI003F5C0859